MQPPVLKDEPMIPTIPARDLARARAWYERTLGLTPEADFGESLRYRTGANGSFLLFRSAGTCQVEHQVAAWSVDDIEAEVAALRARGVEFDEYDKAGLRTVDGVADTPGGRGAWFRDSEGNLLTLMERRPPR